ncbi:MAG TPA: BCCT family transporter [Paracoccaceae bacterium]|nr:BCCT family transporter [Paracoccaceae bacterium]
MTFPDRIPPPRTLWNRALRHMEPPVFFGSAALVIAFVVYGAGWTEDAAAAFRTTQEFVTAHFGWWYAVAVTGFLIATLALLATPARHVRLGGPDARPEFSKPAWFAMLFAAGMGIGLIYFGVAEPLFHYTDPPRAAPETAAALREGMRFSFFHWGLHAWGIYAILALAVAHAHFNRGLPLAPRSVLEPLIGRRHEGWIGHGVDILCTVGTLLGVATSLGLGAMQIGASLERFFGWQSATPLHTGIVAVITVAATVSVVSGVQRGVRRLSEATLAMLLLLMVWTFFAGPTLYALELLISTFGGYVQRLPAMSLWLDPGAGSDWQTDWTLFYWGWWISWSPFVAIFVARVSKGRTVKEFVLGVLLAPTGLTFVWLATFGGAALHAATAAGDAAILSAVQEDVSASLQELLSRLALPTLTTAAATAVIALFFVTSSDSGSLVDDMVTSGGDPNPPTAQRVFWALSEGAVAVVLLLLGGLSAIRNAAISLGLPMSLVVLAAAFAVWTSLGRDPMARRG